MTQLYHDKITDLFDEYYSAEKDAKPAPNKRIESADSLIEDYIEQHGIRPPNGVLSRLATYILLDTLTDSHPDKMARDEYPIMSEHQSETRQGRERSVSVVRTGKDDVTIGRRTDHDGVKRRIYDYMTPERDMALVPTKYLDLYSALDNAGLTERQRQAIDLVYFEGMTQEAAGEVMGVSKSNVNEYIRHGITKIRREMVGE